MAKMRILSFNVNGIRAVSKKVVYKNKTFLEWLRKDKADILCIQEIKAQEEQITVEFDGYHRYISHAEKKGYSGTMVFSKIKALNVSEGIGINVHDNEGRTLTLEYEDYYLVNVYTPNSQRGLHRLDYRMEWYRAFLSYVKDLEKKKPAIICGDLNVAHKEIDIARPKDNMTTDKKSGNPGFTDQERSSMDKIIESGYIDTFREFNKEGGHYTWWMYMFNAREKNIGWRIDYFLISKTLRLRLKDAFILPDVMGSDHCPVGIELVTKNIT